MPRPALSLPLALLVLGACQRDEPGQRAPLSRSTASAGAARLVPPGSQDTGFAGTTSAVHRPPPGVPPRILRAVDEKVNPGYDRVTFESTGDSLPGYHVEYTSGPAGPGSSRAWRVTPGDRPGVSRATRSAERG